MYKSLLRDMTIDRNKIKAINDYYIRVWNIRQRKNMDNGNYERARLCDNLVHFYERWNEKLESDKKMFCLNDCSSILIV